ncbi:carboxymuconolactone decarboxylase family protein [Rhodococcus sp. NPDC058505]|uniref:carboxymuconolactone decarboxylase family protein n=1 Tax=unclassified Rhodococcus (in: high G+C Gram-positive bacteria) TaxID=192944 RepID=UPI003654BAF4
MKARMNNPAMVLPGAVAALQAVSASTAGSGLPPSIVHLVHIRASQINGCSVCLEMHSKEALRDGDSTDRLLAVAAWRESSHFSDPERAALALTEAVTRIADRPDAVPDPVWDDAADHFDEQQLAALTLEIATINLWNRLNVTVRQPAGQSW